MTQTHLDFKMSNEMICDEEQPSFCSIQSLSDYSDEELETKTTSNSDLVSVIMNSCKEEPNHEACPSPQLNSCAISSTKLKSRQESFHLHDTNKAESESCVPNKSALRGSRIPLPVSKLFTSSPRPLLKRKSVSLMDVSNIEPFTELNPVLSWDTIVSEGSNEKSKDSGYNCSTSMFSINSIKASKHEEELNQLNESLKKELEYREVMINTLQESNMELRMKCAEAENKIVELRLKCQKINSCCCTKKKGTEEKKDVFVPCPHVSSGSNESNLSEATIEPSSIISQSISRPSSSSTDKATEKKYPKDHRHRPNYKSTVVDCNLVKSPLQHSRSQGFKDNDLQKHLIKQWQERHPKMKLESVFKSMNSVNSTSHNILNGSGDRSVTKAERLISDMFKDMKNNKSEPQEKALVREGQFRPWLHSKDSEEEKRHVYGSRKRKGLDLVKSNSSVDISWDSSSDSSSRFKHPEEKVDSMLPNVSEVSSVRITEKNFDITKGVASRSVGTNVHQGGSPIVDKYFSMMESPNNRADYFKFQQKRNEKFNEKVISMQKEGESTLLSSFLPRQSSKDISLRQWTELILKDKESNVSNLTRVTVTRKESHAEQLSRWNELKERLSHLKIPSSQATSVASCSELPVAMPVSSQLVSNTLPISSQIGNNMQLPVSRFLSSQLTSADASLNFFSDSSQNGSPKSAMTLKEILVNAEKYATELSVGLAAIPPKLQDIQSIGH